MSESIFTLHDLQPEDGPALAALGEQTPETGQVSLYSRFHYDAYLALSALDPTLQGVVARAPGRPGIVGMGLMRQGECWYEGAVRPYAYLYSWSVHPDFRRRGVASQIVRRQVETVRARLGSDVVIFAGIQEGNDASVRTAQKWSTQRIDQKGSGRLVRMRTAPPREVPGWTVRPAEANDWPAIARQQNEFYRYYNLYPPRTAEALRSWHAQAPFGFPLHEYHVVVDSQGNILAGLSLTNESRLITSQVVRLKWPLKAANLFLRLLPPDGQVKRVPVKEFWFAPNRQPAATYLWESMRWLERERGTLMMIAFDPRCPLAPAIPQPRWVPTPGGSIVLAGPVPLRAEHLLYFQL
jgi:ribosomal protein S18 acetylase RimI-like enzyme